jgi:hypothetical protein
MHITLEINVKTKFANFRFTVPTFTWKDCKKIVKELSRDSLCLGPK